MRTALTALATAATLVAPPTLACSYFGDRNFYRISQRESLDQIVGRATYIEHVSLDANDAVQCPRSPRGGSTQEDWDAWRSILPERCPESLSSGIGYFGTVLERFVGAGPDRIELFRTEVGGVDLYFSDVAAINPSDRALVEEGSRRRVSLHEREDFWLEPGIRLFHDNSDSCGGRPTLDPASDYLVFRDERGAVFGAEPVSGVDDPLLVWLRLPEQSNERRGRIWFTAAEAFGIATHLAEVELSACPTEAWGPPVIRQMRGGDFRRAHQEDLAEPFRLYVMDWLAWREIECRPLTLLVVDVRTGGAYLSPSFAVVEDGMVETASLFPGVNIEGPARISVDQAFEWFEAGREP